MRQTDMSEAIQFRPAREWEKEQVFALWRAAVGGEFCAWDEEYPGREHLEQDYAAGNLYVLAEDGRVIGALSVVSENELDDFDIWQRKDGAHREIARITVAGDCRGRGLAGHMVGAISMILWARGCSAIHLSAAKGNLPARKTYAKQGFAQMGEAELYGGEYILLEKLL